MKLLKAIIIDDEIQSAELLSLTLKDLFPDIRVGKICTWWADALHALKDNDYDLVFIDIMMPGKTGIELMRLLPGIKAKIIFITAYQEYALDAFKCYASGYLLKPVDDAALLEVVSRAIAVPPTSDTAPAAATTGILGIPGLKGIDYIPVDQILYLQAEKGCTRVVLKDKVIISSYYLGRFRDFLPDDLFFQIHRSCIINLNAVKRYLHNQSSIVMNNDMEIPVARSIREELLQRFVTITKSPISKS